MKLKKKISFKHLQTRPDSVKTCFSFDIFDVLNKTHNSIWNWRWKLILTRLKFLNKTCFDIFDITNKTHDWKWWNWRLTFWSNIFKLVQTRLKCISRSIFSMFQIKRMIQHEIENEDFVQISSSRPDSIKINSWIKRVSIFSISQIKRTI